ncbi:hypothetical protein M433DRAFT_156085 [Acidomyces richmondensis BFW]|nr:MAG: hypothetical protein FE78DRAFT_93537 [Acidomyces sp. 'richmondensis']KYG44013.1 hypothetical protein M433DRAFT_156085 [Acidomyces richmondensis BFW]
MRRCGICGQIRWCVILVECHAPAAGFANINHGVTIDMTGISTITTSKSDYTVASVGAGSSWVDVYAALEPFNRTVAGGRNGAVGVGGLTLGGGISYFSPQVGFTCDTVVGFEVVLADGRVVQASANSPFDDLFKALKGGMNNFGIVTQIDFFTIPLPKEGILGGSVVYDIKYAADVFRAFATISGAPQYDIHASIVIGAIFNSTARSWTLSSTPIYTLPEIQPAAYEELFAIPNITSSVTLVKLSTFSNESVTPPLNWLFYTATFGVSAELLDDIFSIANESLYNFDVPGGVLWDLAFEPFPTAFLSHSNGQDVLGTSPADSNGIILLVSALWPELADDDAVHTKAVEMMTKVRARAVRMGMLKRFVYGNYADWSQLPIESYGKENVEFLRKVSAKYDPDGVFQKKVTGGFKLPATRRIK